MHHLKLSNSVLPKHCQVSTANQAGVYEQTSSEQVLLPGGPLIGVLGDSIWSLWIDFGRCFFCFATWGRGLITVSMSSISFSCFRLMYSCLMNSLRARSSSFFWRSSSVFRLRNQRAELAILYIKYKWHWKSYMFFVLFCFSGAGESSMFDGRKELQNLGGKQLA